MLIVLHQGVEEAVDFTVNTTTTVLTAHPEPEENDEDLGPHQKYGTIPIPGMC